MPYDKLNALPDGVKKLPKHAQEIYQDAFNGPTIPKGDAGNHPCPKPVRLFQWLLAKASEENDVILDPFLGSGTTALACVLLERNCIGIEKNNEFLKHAKSEIYKISKMRKA